MEGKNSKYYDGSRILSNLFVFMESTAFNIQVTKLEWATCSSIASLKNRDFENFDVGNCILYEIGKKEVALRWASFGVPVVGKRSWKKFFKTQLSN